MLRQLLKIRPTHFLASCQSGGLIPTAVILNLYNFREAGKSKEQCSLAERIVTILPTQEQDDEIRSIIPKTEGLSPPVVGIIRRATQDIILQPSISVMDAAETLVP